MSFYVLKSDSDDAYDYDILLLFYPSEVEGTNLESKLLSCFDEVAKHLLYRLCSKIIEEI